MISTLPKSDEFAEELEIFRTEVEQAGQFYYAFLTIHAVAGENRAVFQLLNSTALFWNTVLGALQKSTFIAIGRIFDQKSAHNVDKLLNIASKHPEIFSRASLGHRKQEGHKSAPVWLNDYLSRAYFPSATDFRRLRTFVRKNRRIYEANYRALRTRVYAHKELSDREAVSALFAKTKIAELEQMLRFLHAIYDALWELFFNGRKPVLRLRRFSIRQMRKKPSRTGNRTVFERIIHEAELVLLEAAAAKRTSSRSPTTSRRARV